MLGNKKDDKAPVETSLAITDLQYEMLERAEQVFLQAQANVKLVYDTILAGHDVGEAEVVRMDESKTGRVLVVRILENGSSKSR